MFEYPVAHLAEITWNNCLSVSPHSAGILIHSSLLLFSLFKFAGIYLCTALLKTYHRLSIGTWLLLSLLTPVEAVRLFFLFHMTLYRQRTRACHQEPRISSKVLHRITETHGSPIMSPCSSYHVGWVMLAYTWCNLTSMTVSLMHAKFEGCLQSKSRHKINTRSLLNPYFHSQ